MAGLSSAEARERLARGQGNVQIDTSAKSVGGIVRSNVFTYFNLIFAVLAVLVIIARRFNALTFLVVVVANMCIGIVQEIRAKKVLDELSLLHARTARVLRDGAETEQTVDRLVLGDVIVLGAGAQIPADAVVTEGEVSVNEALLTGEADEIEKHAGDALMSGSFVVSGECMAELTQVGRDSYINRLTLKARRMRRGEQSEMVRSIDRIVKGAGILVIPIGITLFLQSYRIQGHPFDDSIASMVAAVVGMIPEGLYLLVSVTLAASAMRLARSRVMLHEMKSIESLARVDTLCVDKTGTITDTSMLVAQVIPAHDMDETTQRLMEQTVAEYISALPNDNATSRALHEYFRSGFRRRSLSALPFSSKNKYSAVQFADATYIMGAPEIIMRDEYERYRGEIESFARKGLRVVVFCRYGEDGRMLSCHVPEHGIGGGHAEPIFYILLQNPIRRNATKIFGYFRKQGVDVRVISGDSPLTASEVAKMAGIPGADKYVDARELTTPEQVRDAVRTCKVFGRVTPEQKQMIVRALKREGHTVAMTGDGVNDILAMKDADCSIGMAAGADAAVQAAQVVLLDSDFAHLPEIVSEGRRVINNIERSSTLFLVKNIFSLLLSIFSIVSLVAYPLEPSQVSLVSMFNIGIPAFFLAMEHSDRRIEGRFMRRVLLRAMPAALTDFLAIAALVLFGRTFGVRADDISVASTILLAIVGFMIVFSISRPLTKYRARVIAGCVAGFVFCAYTMHDLFSISYMSKECVMLFVLFAIATEPCMRYLTRVFSRRAGGERVFNAADAAKKHPGI